MSKAGQVIENPVTGEHVHPAVEEHLAVVRGRVGCGLNERETIAQLGQHLNVPIAWRTTGGMRARSWARVSALP